MKNIFTLLLVLTATTSFSQLSVGLHVGSSNKNMIAGMHSQYQFKNGFTTGINMTAHYDNSNPSYFQSRFGYTLGNANGFSIQPYIGHSLSLQYADQKDLSGHFTTGVQVRYQINEIGLIYSDVNIPSNKYVLISIGIAGRFPGKK